MLADRYRGKVDAVAGLESRGFILAAPLAIALGVGMVTIRKAGRLPGPVVGVDYDLEYGSARMEVQPFTVEDGQRVLILDDVLATGGTANAAFNLVEQAGGVPVGLCVLIELVDLGGRAALDGREIEAILSY
ncbi:MAG: adenine phosphoribosyltransferase, partial [Ancrocorticia sp.]|nr:adenine phosphoribosyltransferase [Ancrocorticia sp.]